MEEKKIKTEVFTCPHCGNKTDHKELFCDSKDIFIGFSPSGDKIYTQDYTIVYKCPTCSNLTIKSFIADEIDEFSGEINMDYIHTIYPTQKEFPEDMPETITKIYKEALRVKKISPISFSILIRKGLEALCEAQGATGRNLKERLLSIIKKMELPSKFVEMIDSMRLLGNKSVHEIDFTITNKQAESLDYFFIAIIEYVYIAPHKLAEIQKSLK